jgi:AcrR family transcriptional regulator
VLESPLTRRGAVTRSRLIAAALELFAARGYHATTTALLAERTGIAEGTIYRHFPGKDALYSAVCLSVWETLEQAIARASEGTATPRERLADAAGQLIHEAQRHPAATRFQSRPLELTVLDEAAQDARTRFRDRVTQLVAAGKQEGAIRSGAADFWASIWLAIIWSVCERVAAGELTPSHPNVGLAIDAAWELLRNPPQPPSLPAA